jgi:hypothetical protein
MKVALATRLYALPPMASPHVLLHVKPAAFHALVLPPSATTTWIRPHAFVAQARMKVALATRLYALPPMASPHVLLVK